MSRDGKYLAAPTESLDTKSLWVYEVTAAAPPNPLVTSIPSTGGHGFATISPDDVNMVAAYKGLMWQLDRATGNKVVDLPLGAMKGTQPDWSPDGDEVVFANEDGDAPSGAGLARIAYNNGAWGTPTVFLPPPANKSNLFPMFSPNADWIAFAQGKGGHGDDTAQLFVIASQGSPTPIEMVAANRITSNTTTDGQYQNSQPTWAPPGDLHWVAFNTKREYGVVSPEGRQQIWVAAVDTTKAGMGVDPSYPAFRVPFQGLNEDNHRAFWTLDVADGSGGSGGGGGGATTGGGCTDILTVNDPCDPLPRLLRDGLVLLQPRQRPDLRLHAADPRLRRLASQALAAHQRSSRSTIAASSPSASRTSTRSPCATSAGLRTMRPSDFFTTA